MAKGEKVWARLPFGYGMKVKDGKTVGCFRDRGEVFTLVDGRNDETLRTNRYFLPFDSKEHKEISCDRGCGRFFINMTFLSLHYRKRNCDDDSAIPTKVEYSELIGADPDKFKMESDESNQVAKDLTGEV
jgi:hypothetical protein